MDILRYMQKPSPKRKRPGVLVRFYPDDLAALNVVCSDACTPRENYIRRVTMLAVRAAHLMHDRHIGPGSHAHVEIDGKTGGAALVVSMKRRRKSASKRLRGIAP